MNVTLSVFRPLGKVFEVEEKDMTAVTALASCGIAYILKYIDASFKGGQEIGIDAKTIARNSNPDRERRSLALA